jgi:hypothetical protein
MRLFWLAATCGAVFSIASCQKIAELNKQSTYTFRNNTNERITLDIYTSKEDYDRNTGRAYQYLVAPGASQKIALGVAKTYWMDWYNATYALNNWRSSYLLGSADNPWPPPEITVAAEDDHFDMTCTLRDTSRSILLQDNGLQSRWSGSIANAGELNGTFYFEFRKDFGGIYSFTDAHGATSTKPIRYTVANDYISSGNSYFTLTVFDEQPDKFCSIHYPATGINQSRDTLTLTYSRWSFMQYWKLTRLKP